MPEYSYLFKSFLSESRGVRGASKRLAQELYFFFRHCYGIFAAVKYNRSKDLKLHLGCGQRKLQGWINVDLSGDPDLPLDLRARLPFNSNSCAEVFSEHFLEHLTYPGQARDFLNEITRVLKVGGILRISVPDTEWPLVAYVNKDGDYFENAKKLWHPGWCQTRMEHINYHFRQNGEHQFAYDYATLHRILEKAGFMEIHRAEFKAGVDSAERKIGTLYVEARKL